MVEDVLQGFPFHSRSGIADSNQHVLARWNLYFILFARMIQSDRLRTDGKLASLCHGVAGVHGQVHGCLLHLAAIDLYTESLTALPKTQR